MQKFSKALRGYNPEEVNEFLDGIISKVESMISDIKKKDEEIERLKIIEIEYNALKNKNEDVDRLKTIELEYNLLKQKTGNYERMEETLKRAILMAEKTSEQIKISAYKEREILINDAKKNANRIVNEALFKAESVEKEAESLKRNVVVLKRRLKDILETQLELVDDIEKIDFE